MHHGAPTARCFSGQLWALDWEEQHLPWTLDNGVRIEIASVEATLAFVRDHYATIFASDPEDERFVAEPPTPAKHRFLELSDRFLFRDADTDQVIGILVGNPVDWSTYYWRTVAFLPEHQGRGLLAAALERTDGVMRSIGIERIEGECAPANYRQVRLLLRLGYCITGQSNSERWGAMLRLTRFLRPEGYRVFKSQFCRDRELPGQEAESVGVKGERDEEVCDHDLLTPTFDRSPAAVCG